ncbi:sialoadhesin-like [Poecilia formosa]|uniref:sialoadhesin-like n=1 Tax=Poecilia formosa TaxID=48698 RepID=UPI0007B79FFD|nr:PREDICTED: sialoadhesin-like [Poecilia formosa]
MGRLIPAGGSVTLTCSVNGSTGWKFDWFRYGQQYPADGSSGNTEPDGTIRVSEGGEYSCRGGRGDPVSESETSNKVTIWRTDPNKPSLVLQPNWSQIYRGEKVTLRCEIQGGTQWTYEWRTTNRNSPSSSEYKINSATESLSGEYSCRGKREGFSWTPWSNVVNIAVSPKPQPVLSVSPSWLNPGASVTLSCEGLEHQPAGWRFFWYKAVPGPSSSSYTSELLPGSTNGSEQNSFIINGPTLTAGFVCRAGRGEPEFYTYYSEPKFIWSADPRPAASLSVNPDRVQHFYYDPLSLSCEGNSTEWRVKRFTERGYLSYCSIWGTMTGSTCTIKSHWFDSGVYWCESGSGEFSNAVNITAQNDYYDRIILLSPVHPVTEGDPVTLRCRNKDQLLSNVFFYHNDKLLHNDSREDLNISAVSKSDEGFYKCQHSGKDSPRSWMSVRVAITSPVSSSVPVMFIIGPVVGILLIILLLLLWRCNQSKGLCCIRSKGSEVRGQSSTTNQPEGHEYRSLSHENAHLYDMIGSAEAAGNAADGHPEVTYSLIEMKSFGKERRQGEPEEGAVYSEVKTGAADSAQTYAEIDHEKKVKKKAKDKGKSRPAAAEAAVYSEIRSAPALENNAAM